MDERGKVHTGRKTDEGRRKYDERDTAQVCMVREERGRE